MQNNKLIKNYIFLFAYVLFMSTPLIGALLISWGDKVVFSFTIRHFFLLINSVKLYVYVGIIVLVLGFLCALFIYNLGINNSVFEYYFVFSIPMPFYIYGLSWMYLVKVLSLFYTKLLQYSIRGIGACVFVESLAYLPISTLLFLLKLNCMDINELRMASLYGNDKKTLVKFVIKYMTPMVFIILPFIAIFSLTDFSVPSMFQYNTFALDIFSVYSRTGNALIAYYECIPLVVLLLFPIMILINNIDEISYENNINFHYKFRLGKMLDILMFMSFFISIIQIALPFITFIIMSGGLFSIIESIRLINNEVLNSLLISFFAALLCMLISSMPQKIIAIKKRKAMLFLLIYTLMIPGAIQAMGLLKVVNNLGLVTLQKSLVLTSVGCALKFAPIIVMVLYIFNSNINTKGINLANLFKINSFRYFVICFHEYAPQYLLAFMLVFLMSFAEESISLILMVPGKETLSVKIYNYLHYGSSEYVSSFVIISIIIISFLEILVAFIIKYRFIKTKYDYS